MGVLVGFGVMFLSSFFGYSFRPATSQVNCHDLALLLAFRTYLYG
jgi:hypothetical protein